MNKQGLPYFGMVIDEKEIEMSLLTCELSGLLGVGYYTWVDHFNGWITKTVYSNKAGLQLCIELAKRNMSLPWESTYREDRIKEFINHFMKPHERITDGSKSRNA